MSNADLFKAAKEKHAKHKKEQEEKRAGFQQTLYSKLMPQGHVSKGYVQVRVLGNPMEFRNGSDEMGVLPDPTSPKVVYQSWVMSDDKKKFPVVWPSREERPDWILYRVMDKVLEAKWDPTSNTKRYLNQETHPDLFLRVFKNNNTKNPYEKGWYPKALMVMNVIDRSKMTLHREKKHTFILSKASEGKERDKDGNIIEYADGGVSPLVYDALMHVVGEVGDFNAYDVIVKRTEDRPYYQVFHGTEKLRFADFPYFKSEFIDAPLTEEELSWERYNIDTLYPITPYKVILAKLRQFFVQLDREFGTAFLPELEQLVEAEAKEQAKAPVKTETSSPTTVAQPPVSESKPIESPAPVARRSPAPAPKQEVEEQDPRREALMQAGYKHQGKLTDEELDVIEYVDDDGSIVWSEDAGELLACDACNTMTPGSLHHCPKCGAFFG